jgi:hypothetical protein
LIIFLKLGTDMHILPLKSCCISLLERWSGIQKQSPDGKEFWREVWFHVIQIQAIFIPLNLRHLKLVRLAVGILWFNLSCYWLGSVALLVLTKRKMQIF